MAFDFFRATQEKQKHPFQLNSSSNKAFPSTSAFKYDPKSSVLPPSSQVRYNFDDRPNRYFKPVTEEEVEDLALNLDALALEVNKIEATVKKNKFEENAQWAQKKMEKLGATANPFALKK